MTKRHRIMQYMRFAAAVCVVVCMFSASADAVSRYAEGNRLQSAGDFYGAIEIYREVLNENASYGDAWKSFAECAYEISEYGLCLSCVDHALELHKNNPDLHNLRAFALIGATRFAEAREEFLFVLSSYPNDVQARFGLAELNVAEGKTAAATELYRDALVRQPENRKALLSLAVVCGETGNYDVAESFVDKALKYHGGDPEVLYFAGWLAMKRGNVSNAEGRLRSALAVRSDFPDASALLVSLLYSSGRYREAAALCDEIILSRRNTAAAWYVKALSLEQNGDYQAALDVYTVALQQFPNDSLLRTSFEFLIQRFIPIEDDRRSQWAAYHVQQAEKFASDFYSDQALFEYRRALKIDPHNTAVRQNYAALMLKKGWPVRYLEQLSFAIEHGLDTTVSHDAKESYTSLLHDALYRTWNVNMTLLDTAHTSVGIYYMPVAGNVLHPGAERVTAELLGDVLAHTGRYAVSVGKNPIAAFSDAFRAARKAGQEYFVFTQFEENEEDIKITLDVYSGRTGAHAVTLSAFRTGSDRYYSAVRRSVRSLVSVLPFKAVLLQRDGNQGLIDRGFVDGVAKDAQYTIIKKNSLSTADEGFGFRYKSSDVTGTFTVTAVDEDLAQGVVKNDGFYDKISAGDSVIFVPSTDEQKDADNQPDTVNQERAGAAENTVQSISDDVRTPALLRLLQSID